MKANELRIGNWANRYRGDPTNIPAAPQQFTTADFNYLAFFEPIPLTEEWLLKLGFILNSNQFELNEIIVQLDTHTSFLIADDPYCSHEVKQKIEFIHQLQNLYFALTGTELEIK